MPVSMEKDDGVGRPEELINSYVRLLTATGNITSGIGTLALLWSTVVLLGGFVSVLEIKDFWFLTALSFVMASRMVENYDNEFKREIYLEEANILVFIGRQKWIPVGISRTQRFVLGMVLVPKSIMLMCLSVLSFNVMPYVSVGISVWRLVRRDYGNAGGDVINTAKLNGALDIFYALVLFQSLLVLYWLSLDASLDLLLPEVAQVTSKQCRGEKCCSKLVAMYCSETKRKFKKDGELPSHWNLITYGIELLQSASGDDNHRWGARVLDKLSDDEDTSFVKQELLSSRLSIQNLMGMIGPRATTGNMECRDRAIRIVTHLATDLHITRFPGTLQCICSLLESSCKQQGNSPRAKPDKTDQGDEERTTYLERVKKTLLPAGPTFKEEVREYSELKYRHHYKSMGAKELVSQGLLILERLTQDEGNCSVISKDQRLVCKITAPLRSHDILGKLHDNTMVQVLNKALTVLSRLLTSPGDSATRLHQELASNTEVVNNLMGIFETYSDNKGAQELHEHALDILAELAFEGSFQELDFNKFFKTLLCIFIEEDANNTTVQEANNTTVQVEQAEDTEKATRLRGRAAEALTRLLSLGTARCTISKQMMINILTTVLNEISSSKMGTATDTSIGSNSRALEITVVGSQPLEEADTDNVQPPPQENEKQSEERKFMSAMLSLAVVIYNENVISKADFAYCATPEDDEALVKKLKEILEVNKNSTAECLRIVKLICQVVIDMIKVKPSCIQNFNAHSFKEALVEALETMSELDDCMLFGGNDREVIKPVRSLASLVREAEELLQTA